MPTVFSTDEDNCRKASTGVPTQNTCLAFPKGRGGLTLGLTLVPCRQGTKDDHTLR